MTAADDNGDGFWVFGYGSLIWHPGFRFEERRRASLDGFRRSLCIFSVRYRGTRARPGLVFGLETGGLCEGMAYRVAADDIQAVTDYLRDREQVTGVYRATLRTVAIHGGPNVRALCFIANKTHPQYAGRLLDGAKLAVVKAAHGSSGPNADYVFDTERHLREMGVRDYALSAFVTRLGPRIGARTVYPRGLVGPLPAMSALRCSYQRRLGF